MEESVSTLADDLEQKYQTLCSMHDLPDIYLSDYFSEVKHRIDIDVEKTLVELDARNFGSSLHSKETAQLEIARMNALREKFMRILRKMKDELLRDLSPPTDSNSSEIYSDIGKRIDEFRKSFNEDRGNLEEQKGVYLSLAQEILDKSSQLEALLFRNQTICYISTTRENEMESS